MQLLNKPCKIDMAAALFLALAAFFLTLWRFGANQLIAILALMVLFYRPWRKEFFSWSWVKTPVILFGLIFVGWAIISASYSETPTLAKALQGVSQYSKLLFLLVWPIAVRGSKYQKWVENGLIYGVLINVILSTLNYFQVPFVVNHLEHYFSMGITFTVNPLQVIYVVVMAIWLLMMRLTYREGNKFDVLVLVLLLIYLWFINLERSGFLIFIAVFLFYLASQFGKKAVIAGCIAIPIFFVALYFVLSPFKDRVDIGIHNIEAYSQTQNVGTIGADNSLGLRLAFTQESIAVIKDHPLIGTGIGSFKYVHAALYPEQEKAFPANDPHEAYIAVAFELGLVGLALYVAWLIAVLKMTFTLANKKDRTLLQGVWLIFVVMGFTDSGLILNAVGISFIMWISLYLRQSKQASLPTD